jgi:hypothetical protein
MLWLKLERERLEKTTRILSALGAGWGEPAQMTQDDPPDDGNPFVVWGQLYSALRLIPQALKTGRPFWQLDNGFWQPGRGGNGGFYRLNYRGLSPILMDEPSAQRGFYGSPLLKPWRKTGKHILLAFPGDGFGRSVGLDMTQWAEDMKRILPTKTDRPIVVRPKKCGTPLAKHFDDCWALVTHSSNVAVDAAIAGVPVFVAASNPAAPVGNLDLEDLENPVMPARKKWLYSLSCQQYTIEEMKNGTAYEFMSMVRKQVDA